MRTERHAMILLAGAAAALAGPPRAAAENVIDLRHLLVEMTDRAAIAEYPSPEFTCRQASSYNRRSKVPGTPEWFAGADFDQFQGSVEVGGRREWIMLDADGPGAVVRWWQTQVRGSGTFRIYLDGADEPLVVGPGDKLVGGGLLAGAPLSATPGQGRNLYLPLPFSKHCRITYQPEKPDADFTTDSPGFTNESLFYNINFIRYPDGTPVKSLTMADLDGCRERIAATGERLLHPADHPLPVARRVAGGRTKLAPGESMVRRADGPGALAGLRIRPGAAKDLPQALRSTVLTLSFDGRRTVAAPLGEFFGAGLGLHPYQSWWSAVGEDGWMTCWWPMPFRESAELRVTNHHATEPVEIEIADLGIADWQWTDRTMYFHTTWRGGNLIEFGDDDHYDEMEAWNFVTIAGRGVHAGDSLSLYNRPRMNWHTGPWWGEGDEKIFIDGENFPSHFGTGTEDYYGYAFNFTRPFSAPFHAQPSAGGNWGIGHTTNVRGRVLDRIPFQRSLRLEMELFHWQPKRRVDYATTTHWYAFPGATAESLLTPARVREPVAQPWTGPEDGGR